MEKIHNDREYIKDKFVEYQSKAKAVYLDFLLNYVKDRGLNGDETFFLVFAFAFTYSELDGIYIFETFDRSRLKEYEYIEEYYDKHKKFFNFCSARTKFNFKKFFVKAFNDYYKRVENLGAENTMILIAARNAYDKYASICGLEDRIGKIAYIGEFSSRKFVEVIEYIGKFGDNPLYSYFENTKNVDRYSSKSMTLGALRCITDKETHEKFRNTGKLEEKEIEKLNEFLKDISERIYKYEKSGRVSQNVFVQKLCSFENLYKNKRYGGYHHDRQLVNLKRKEKAGIDKDYVKRMYELRAKSYPKEMLGEFGGWDGYRNRMKELRTKKGYTGVEALHIKK